MEILISIAVIALLLSMLLPLLSHAREAGYRAVCGNNLRQMSVGWNGFIQDHKETFPMSDVLPEWNYGGVTFAGLDFSPRLDAARPINRYLADITSDSGEASPQARDIAKIFHCPSDSGIYARGSQIRGTHAASILGQAGGQTCYQYFGNSYKANSRLFAPSPTSPDQEPTPIRLHDILIDASRLLIAGDPAWYFANPDPFTGDSQLDASWHSAPLSGHFLAADGSIRFVSFATAKGREYELSPRP